MAFTHTLGRYASFGTVASIPGEVIDLFWYIIDNDLKGVFELDSVLDFTLLNRQGMLSVRFREGSRPELQLVVDADYPFDSDWPRHFHAIDQNGRETIMLPAEI